jgi:hypothetical protein
MEPLAKILPFVFLFGFDEVHWDAVANETEAMRILSENLYNWTVVPERQVGNSVVDPIGNVLI